MTICVEIAYNFFGLAVGCSFGNIAVEPLVLSLLDGFFVDGETGDFFKISDGSIFMSMCIMAGTVGCPSVLGSLSTKIPVILTCPRPDAIPASMVTAPEPAGGSASS